MTFITFCLYIHKELNKNYTDWNEIENAANV